MHRLLGRNGSGVAVRFYCSGVVRSLPSIRARRRHHFGKDIADIFRGTAYAAVYRAEMAYHIILEGALVELLILGGALRVL